MEGEPVDALHGSSDDFVEDDRADLGGVFSGVFMSGEECCNACFFSSFRFAEYERVDDPGLCLVFFTEGLRFNSADVSSVIGDTLLGVWDTGCFSVSGDGCLAAAAPPLASVPTGTASSVSPVRCSSEDRSDPVATSAFFSTKPVCFKMAAPFSSACATFLSSLSGGLIVSLN